MEIMCFLMENWPKTGKKWENNTGKVKLNEFFIILNSGKLNFVALTSLTLTKCNLSELPQCFKHLQVRVLNLSHNAFKQVPNCFYSGLNNLENLDLSHNLVENFDMSPNCVAKLRILRLNHNSLYNVPLWIKLFEATCLERFAYSENRVKSLKITSKTFPFPLVLKHVEMANCYLIDSDFRFLKNLTGLEHLDISNNTQMMENYFKNINKLFESHNWKRMAILNLNNLKISYFPRTLCFVQTVRELYIVNCDLSYFPPELKFLENLETLDCSHNGIFCLKQLIHLKRLRHLNVSHNHVEAVPNFQLDFLDLYENCLNLRNYAILVENCALIDLEMNYFDTSTIENAHYKQKCLDLRREIDENRSFGRTLSTQEFESAEVDLYENCVENSTCDFEEKWFFDHVNEDWLYCDAD